PQYRNVHAGLFLSSGEEMIVSDRRKIHTIDLRNLKAINTIKTKHPAEVLYEYGSCLFYSGKDLYARGVCPITGTSLFSVEHSNTLFSSDADGLYMVDDKSILRKWRS